ncbi:NAD-dependent DNA ligase LigA [Helicobacter sp. 16-1353]|uniref:NAD-dependent DNA ligase LigA n=1 Tax=Helicobacter sp. 16-1353 TaxID=2004996 RepID=UPI0015EEC415|nr:NAD-dependent DNA ligase LigA [Helicobacter sp. 16-1353]
MIIDYNTYKQKTEILKKMAYHYYMLDSPIASDDEYDTLYAELIEFEKQNPHLIDSTSPTQRVGDKISESFPKIAHIEKMWSLDDIFNEKELKLWIERIYKNARNMAFMCDAKFDGASLNLTYDNGILITATTRGDGSIGEMVIENARTINSIPLSIPYKNKIEIRGEVVISKNDFEKLNNERLENGENIFANPRNAASGSLRQLDSKITKKRKLRFIPWGFGYCEIQNNSFFERLNLIKSFGFIDTKLSRLCNNINEIEEFYQELVNIRHSYEIMLDGMVIRLDDIPKQNELGYTNKNPRFAVAYKFPAIEKQTKILDVSFSVGRSGVITPVAELEKVNIEGANISKATLHNFDEIEKKDIRINDTVLIIRSGDVIPKIIKPIKELRNGSEISIKKPTICPVCETKLLIEDILIKCQNLKCKARVKNAIIHFCSKKAMDINGLGEKIVDFLFENGIISNIKDIYSIEYTALEGKEGWQDKKINNLINAIENSKKTPLWRFINALGIEHIGEGTSKKLASVLGFRIFDIDYNGLMNVDGIGEESANSILLFMNTNRNLINELLEIIKPQVESRQNSDILSNEIIVLSGSMSKPRDEIAAKLESLGASISSSVGKKTTMLVIGENPGSKRDKALNLGIKIVNEDELNEIIKKAES